MRSIPANSTSKSNDVYAQPTLLIRPLPLSERDSLVRLVHQQSCEPPGGGYVLSGERSPELDEANQNCRRSALQAGAACGARRCDDHAQDSDPLGPVRRLPQDDEADEGRHRRFEAHRDAQDARWDLAQCFQIQGVQVTDDDGVTPSLAAGTPGWISAVPPSATPNDTATSAATAIPRAGPLPCMVWRPSDAPTRMYRPQHVPAARGEQ
jgi:hypothetical protein